MNKNILLIIIILGLFLFLTGCKNYIVEYQQFDDECSNLTFVNDGIVNYCVQTQNNCYKPDTTALLDNKELDVYLDINKDFSDDCFNKNFLLMKLNTNFTEIYKYKIYYQGKLVYVK